jgi:hypothetical protein
MDTDEQHSTSGKGVPSHQTHCARLPQADLQTLGHLHSTGATRLRCERVCCVLGQQWLRPFCGSGTTIVLASCALWCPMHLDAGCPTHHLLARPPQPLLARVADDSACEYS